MANKKISQLTTLNPVPSGAFLAVVDGGVTYKAAASRVSHYEGSKAATIDGGDTTLDWDESNIYYAVVTASIETTFTNVRDGQTLKYYVENNSGSVVDSDFVSAGTTLYWAAAAPQVAAGKTNFYTFTRINNAIFADVVTGYPL
jgi:hypothetical protein